MKLNDNYSKEEYDDLKAHIQMLLKGLYSNGLTLITCMGALWLIAFKCVDFANISNYEIIIARIGLASFLFSVCSFICYPLFKKECETIYSIASIASYLKVFYEAPSIVFKSNPIYWETITGKHKFNNTKTQNKLHSLFNAEYFVISLASTFLNVVLIFAYFYILVKHSNVISFLTILLIIVLCIILAFQIFINVLILKISNVRKMKNIQISYTMKYLIEAFDLNIFPIEFFNDFFRVIIGTNDDLNLKELEISNEDIEKIKKYRNKSN